MSFPDGENFLWRPTRADPPMCSYWDIVYGDIGMYDLAVMNDILDVHDENRARAEAANESNRDAM